MSPGRIAGTIESAAHLSGEAIESSEPERVTAGAHTPLDAVESALAKALEGAAAVGRFDVVAQLARELEARRLARAGNVVALDTARRKRGSS